MRRGRHVWARRVPICFSFRKGSLWCTSRVQYRTAGPALNFDPALLTASDVGAVGLVCAVWLLRQPTKTRLAVGVAYMALYSYALWRAEIIPLQPPPVTIHGGPRIVSQVLEIFWWFSLARLLVTAGRAFLLIDHRV